MEIFNIGIPELALILLIMLIFLGPDGMVKTARTIAVWVRKLIRSPLWAELLKTQKDIQELPTKFIREAGIEDLKDELDKTRQQTYAQVHTILPPSGIHPAGTQPVEAAPDPAPDPAEEEQPPEPVDATEPPAEDKP